MNASAIYSKSGKGVQEASGKTNLLSRSDRAILSAIDGRTTLADVAQKVGKPFDPAFEKLIESLDKGGFIREVSAGGPSVAPPRPPAAAADAAARGAAGAAHRDHPAAAATADRGGKGEGRARRKGAAGRFCQGARGGRAQSRGGA